ncbi:response regulator [Pseudomonas sp. RIT-PI-S]|uniref:response regulator n=1 Tax=Pseudomonas sp. RIT-PI-S TaxID=3035295 RepID=UPI0021D944B6|nr:response regulator [Pseudomonas sp. RIT-PI-S]
MLNAPFQSNAASPTERRTLVMVVEDEPLIREFVCELMHEVGFETVDYATADDAWKAFDNGLKVNLLITDVRMPGQIDGAQLTMKVRDASPELPIIVMSGHYTEAPEGLEGIAFMPKPWPPTALIDQAIQATTPKGCNAAR